MRDEADLPAADPGEWYVAFYGVERAGWWDILTRPGFRHVMAFAYSSHADRWLVYDVTRDRTYVRAYRPELIGEWIATLPPEATILRVPSAPVSPMRLQRALFICTTSVKHLLGVRSRALRPHGLYRDLVASGAQHAFGTGPQDENPEDSRTAGRSGREGGA